MNKVTRLCVFFVSLLLSTAALTQEIPPEREDVYRQMLKFSELIEGAALTPNWMSDGQSFWYVEGAPAATRILLVDAANNQVGPLFDAGRLRSALTAALGHEPPYLGIPFESFRFVDEETAVTFDVAGRSFRLQMDSYEISELPAAAPQPAASPASPGTGASAVFPGPKGKWTAEFENFNIQLRSGSDGRTVDVSNDGDQRFAWEGPLAMQMPPGLGSTIWSPDGTKLVALKIDRNDVHWQPVLHWLKPNHEEITYQSYPAVGESLPRNHLFSIDTVSFEKTKIDLGEHNQQLIFLLGWSPDGSEFWITRGDRLMKTVELLAADPASGETRVVLTEQQDTFIEGLAFNPANLFYPVGDASRFIWRSERDGWSHLYLYDKQGRVLQQLTKGEAPVQEVVNIDTDGGWVYYLASDDKNRPYDLHLHRVGLDGKGHKRLTETTGIHSITFAPGNAYFLDSHSTVDRPPRTDLKKADGSFIRTVTEADISKLEALNWRVPEEFTVKADDQETDLYGVLYKPFDFDPSRSYPVLDLQYMGNFVHSTPRTFMGTWLGDEAQALTQLGFLVYVVDARGTPGRSKAFQDWTYNNVGKIEVPDHVATLKQLAERHPYMDTSRVGITGYSWGGYFTLRALLTAPDVFHVGVSGAPVVDFIAASRPIEPYMGLPQDNPTGYEQGSNVLLADRLEGKLLLHIGTVDVNVTFNHAMRMVDSLIKANKFFDLLVMPEEAHGLTPPAMDYYREARARYFMEHLKP